MVIPDRTNGCLKSRFNRRIGRRNNINNWIGNWAVDLTAVGAIYPFQGWEVPMTILGVLFWLGWHVMQFVAESKELKDAKCHANSARIIERY